jgi:hypothetical protein
METDDGRRYALCSDDGTVLSRADCGPGMSVRIIKVEVVR